MEKNFNEKVSSSLAVAFVIAIMIVVNIVPFIGPALISFALAYVVKESKFDEDYDLTDKRMHKALLLSEIIFFLFIAWFLYYIIYFLNPLKVFIILLLGMIINYLLALAFYTLGKKYYFRDLKEQAQQMS